MQKINKKSIKDIAEKTEVKNRSIPAINKPNATQAKLAEDRKEWQRQYSYWLNRKNKFAEKLAAHSRPTENSAKYQELDAKVKEYWNLLHDSHVQMKQEAGLYTGE